MTDKIFWILCFSCLFACQEPSENSEKNETEKSIELENDDLEIDHKNDSSFKATKIERPLTKQMSMHKEGMEESVTAHLYTAPNDFPLGFHTYVPKGFEMETFDTGEGNIISFKRNKAELKLIVLPKSIDNRAGAMQIAKTYVDNEGDANEINNGYRLSSSKTKILTTEVSERKGYYYIWLSNYPVEYADGFGPETHFIKQNLKWN